VSDPSCVLITGATSGLGAHLFERFRHEGWSIIAISRQPRPSAEDEATSWIQADLGSPTDLAGLPEQILATNKHLDVVVYCAVSYPSADDPIEEFEKAMRVNAWAPYFLTKSLIAAAEPSQDTSFIMVNSEVIYSADERSGPYAATKAAMRVFATAAAHAARSSEMAVSTLLLGPLASEVKRTELQRVADARSVSLPEIENIFLKRSNPNMTIRQLINLDSCYESVLYLRALGASANGMLCRLDGGSAGSLA